MRSDLSLSLDLRSSEENLPTMETERDAAGALFVQRFRAVWRVLPAAVKKQVREIVEAEHAQQFDQQARQVLEFMNAKRPPGKRGFKMVEANLRLIRARLREGYTVDELRAIVAKKWRQVQAGDFPERYYRPLTLFNAEKCAQYVGELGAGS